MLNLFVKLFRPDFFARIIKGKNNAIILYYHSPLLYIFNNHIEYLNKYYNFISLQKLVDAINSKNWDFIPKNALVLTFDDGHISNYDLSPVFKKYNIRPTIYLCSGVVGTNKKYWWNDLEPGESRKIKSLSNKERLRKIANNNSIINKSTLPVALTEVHIKEMSEFVDFQSHTRNHPIVTMLDDDELKGELVDPIEDLKKYGLDIKHFAFPNGDYSTREINYLKNNGYISARTTDIGWNNIKSNLYNLKVMGISDNASIPKLRLQVSGLFGWIFHIVYSKNWRGKKKIIS